MSLAICSRLELDNFPKDQGGFYCGVPFRADFILNYFLSKFLKFPQMFLNFLSNSPFPPSPAGRLEQLKPPCQGHTFDFYVVENFCVWRHSLDCKNIKRQLREILSPGKVVQVAYFI